ncbi:hypothetical protein [Desulfonatronum lacustre]|uniref:hypothetical protein n=1 Tax=Desulfonatronum lacustre TaxID=66849 RepID=UPI00048C5346|nr:hypothetical protein [Desulfonatronum lacustre]
MPIDPERILWDEEEHNHFLSSRQAGLLERLLGRPLSEQERANAVVAMEARRRGEPARPGYDLAGGVRDVAGLLFDVPVHVAGAFGHLLEDSDPRARHTWQDRSREASELRHSQRREELGDKAAKHVFPSILGLTPPITRGDIVDASASTGSTGVTMGAGLAGAVAGSLAGPVGTVAGGLGLAGASAFIMDRARTRDLLIDSMDEALRLERGRPMNDEEREEYLQRVNMDVVRHALAEAGPEAVGNLLALSGIGSIFRGVGKGFGKKILHGVVKIYGGELGTETVTAKLQHPILARHGQAEGDLSWRDAFQSVYPSSMVLSSLAAGGGALAGNAARNRGKQTEQGQVVPLTEDMVISPESDVIASAKTGQPFEIEAYRGEGASLADVYGQEAVSEGRAVPVLGDGMYAAFSEADARPYGEVKRVKVSLKNPLVISSAREWMALTDTAKAPHLQSTSIEAYNDPAGIPAAAKRLQKHVRGLGHDGIIVRNVIDNKRLRETFVSDQVIQFPQQHGETDLQVFREAFKD